MNINSERLVKRGERRSYSSGEIIAEPETGATSAGVITSGYAYLESVDSDGVRRILDIYMAGDLYLSDSFPLPLQGNIFLVAKRACSVVVLDGDVFFGSDDSDFALPALRDNIVDIHKRLLGHMHILSRHTLRQKIFAFLEYMRAKSGSECFTVEMPYADVADFIGADRNAMLRELKKMSNEGLIARHGRTIELIGRGDD